LENEPCRALQAALQREACRDPGFAFCYCDMHGSRMRWELTVQILGVQIMTQTVCKDCAMAYGRIVEAWSLTYGGGFAVLSPCGSETL